MRTPTAPGHVDAGLDRHDLARRPARVALLATAAAPRGPRAPRRGRARGRSARAWPAAVDDLARDGVDLAARRPGAHGRERRLLGAQHELVDLAVARIDLARSRTCACSPRRSRRAARPSRSTTSVPSGISTSRGTACGSAPCAPAGDDRRERRRLGAHAAHRELEVERDLALGAPREPAPEHRLERGVGEPRGGADARDLLRVLDRPQLLDEAARGDELDAPGRELARAARARLTRMCASSKPSRTAPSVGQPARPRTPAGRCAISRSQRSSSCSADCVR